MATLLLGDDVVLFKNPTIPHAHPNRWFADRGLICWEDQITGEFGSMTVATCLIRLQAHQDMIANSRKKDKAMLPEAIVAFQDYIDRMIEVCKKAQAQGMPDNAAHTKQKAEALRAKRHSRVTVRPGLISTL